MTATLSDVRSRLLMATVAGVIAISAAAHPDPAPATTKVCWSGTPDAVAVPVTEACAIRQVGSVQNTITP